MYSIVLPIFFMSTALIAQSDLKGKLKFIVELNPFTHVINILRDVLLYGKVNILSALKVIVLMAILSSVVFILANYRLKKETIS